MRLQILSDLHLETEEFEPEPAPDADLLVLAGDIDAGHDGLDRFADWPVPVVYVAGNHEFDGRDVDEAAAALRERCDRLGLRMLERERWIATDAGRRIRFVATTLWSDFDLMGPSHRERCLRAAKYYVEQIQRSTRGGVPWDASAMREEALACRDWLQAELSLPRRGPDWDETVVITHFAPSARSADPRYGVGPASASFCNAYDHLLGRSVLWIHGHLHCRHDYLLHGTRVVCNARGHAPKGEADGYDGRLVVTV